MNESDHPYLTAFMKEHKTPRREQRDSRQERATPSSESALFHGLQLTVQQQDLHIIELEAKLAQRDKEVSALLDKLARSVQ